MPAFAAVGAAVDRLFDHPLGCPVPIVLRIDPCETRVALPLEQLEGKYEILEKIREGGMGAIYKVRHVLLGEIRVVKVMRSDLADREEAQERFIREARSAIRLRHPNIAQLHDFSLDDDGTGLIVMEFIDGLSFQDVLKSYGPPGLPLTLEMALQALRALEYLHRLGYVHRDISPDNLMLTRDVDGEPLVKLIDLGIAKGRTSGDPGVTSTGTVLGKIRYAAPENFKSGSASVGARADLYSFGIVLYELLTGAYPIRGRDLNTILAGHLIQPVLNFDDTDPGGAVPSGLRKIVEHALEKDPGKRVDSAEKFWKDLHSFRKRNPPPEMPDGLLDAILSGKPTPNASKQPSPGTTQGLLDREFPPEDTGSSPRPAHLDSTGEPPVAVPPPKAPVAPPFDPPLRGSGLIERAWELFKNGNLDESQRLLDEALGMTPDHPSERGLGRQIAEARDQRTRADAEARREKSRQLIEQAADAFEEREYDRCESLLQEAARADPSDPLPAEEISRLRDIKLRMEEERLEQERLRAEAERAAQLEARRERERQEREKKEQERLAQERAERERREREAEEERERREKERLARERAESERKERERREKERQAREKQDREERERQRKAAEAAARAASNPAERTTAPRVSVPVEADPAPPAFPAPPAGSEDPTEERGAPQPAPRIRAEVPNAATQVVPQQRQPRKPVVLPASAPEPTDGLQSPAREATAAAPQGGPVAAPIEPAADDAPSLPPATFYSTTPARKGLSPWVWSVPAIAVVALAGFLAVRILGARGGADAEAAAAGSATGAFEPVPTESDPDSTPSSPTPGDASLAAASAAPVPGGEDDAGVESDDNTVTLTQSFPILRTRSREEAFTLLRRAEAAGIRATVSRDPSDPLPYAVEAGPHQTAEEARLQARRARTLLGLDRPTPTQARQDPPKSTEKAPAATPQKSTENTQQKTPDESAENGAEKSPGDEPLSDEPPRIEVAVENPEPPPQAGPVGDEPIPVTGEVVKPELIDGPPPVYTRMARRARLEGVVVLRTIIDEQGRVVDATVLKGLPMGLNESALTAVKKWKYQPATLRGEPVKVTFNVAVTFRLQ